MITANSSTLAGEARLAAIEALAETLAASLRPSIPPECSDMHHQLLLLLAEGQSVAPERLAQALGQPLETVLALLKKRPSFEWNAAGHIVGAGITLRPTPHRVELAGRVLYTWCALDALMVPALVGQRVTVTSPCAATRVPVRVTVASDGVKQVEPLEAIVSLVASEASSDVRCVFCSYVNFFASDAVAAAWLAEHPAATTLPVADAFQLGQRLTQTVFRHWAGSPASSR